MKILLTGASGFLGANFLKEIIRGNAIEKIYCVCRSNLPLIEGGQVIHIQVDINEIGNLLIDDAIDVVIHFAAFLRHESSKMFELINVEGTQSVILFCKKNGINKIIHCSSINVKLNNKGGYALSKIKSEELVINSGLRYIIARPALVYGPEDIGLNKMVTSARKFGLVPVLAVGNIYSNLFLLTNLSTFLRRWFFAN